MKKRKTRSRKTRPRPVTHALVKKEIVAPTLIRQGRERELTQSEVDLVQRTVARGTSPDQFALFLWFCRKHQLDPVAKEVYCLLFNNTSTGEQDMAILTGIGGLRGMAARNHPADFGSTDEPEFTWFEDKRLTPSKKLIPQTCTVRVWKKGADRPTVATLYWEEFAPPDLSSTKSLFWNTKPKNQLAKCTEAQALRKAYPDLANIYVREELAQLEAQYTPGGRRIIEAQQPADTQGLIAREVESQKAGNVPSPALKPKKIASGVARNAQTEVPGPVTPGPESKLVVLDWSADETSPVIRGDLSNLVPILQEHCTLTWAGDWWHCQPRDAEKIRQLCTSLGYQLTELMPKVPQEPKKQPAQDDVVVCRIKESIKKLVASKGEKKREVRDVKVVLRDSSRHTWRCWNSNYFQAFDQAKDQVARLVLARNKKYVNIERPLSIGMKQWDDQGLPVEQQPTLWKGQS